MVAGRDRRPGFSRRLHYGVFLSYVLAVAGAVTGAALLLLSALNPALFSALRMGAADVVAPVAGGLSGAGQAVLSIPRTVGTWFRVHGENDRLRRELAAARPLLTRARALGHDNRRLRALLRLRDRAAQPVAAARLVASTPTSTRRYALLNAGRVQGVRPGVQRERDKPAHVGQQLG